MKKFICKNCGAGLTLTDKEKETLDMFAVKMNQIFNKRTTELIVYFNLIDLMMNCCDKPDYRYAD